MRSRRNFLLTVAGSALAALAQQSAKTGSLERVDPKYVCFVTKYRFYTRQLPVAIAGKTYYGCGNMCRAKLKGDASQRSDIDPVSGQKVDKATAVVGADSQGNVYFFENVENLKKYKPAL